MIAACPKCAARYRIEREKIGEAGVRLRCSRCESVFRVRAPAPPVEASPKPAAAPAPQPSQAQQPALVPASRSQQAQQPAPAPAPRPDAVPPELAEISVLVAIPDVELAKQTAQALTDHGAPSLAVFDGVDAMMEIQRRVPKAVVLAADLPKMFGFQICEVLKRNESLKGIRVVLAGAVHHPDRYKREPTELYGADEYVETPDLPEALLPVLRRWGLTGAAPKPSAASGDPFASMSGGQDLGVGASPTSGAPQPDSTPAAPPAPTFSPASSSGASPSDLFELGDGAANPQGASDSSAGMDLGMSFDFEQPAPSPAPQSAPARRPDPVPQPAPVEVAPAPAPAAAPPSALNNEARAAAERLARIIVSDIVLYNEEKFAAAIANGNAETAMSAELDEGRGLFAQRVGADLRGQSDFLAEELVRVARARGMK